MIVGFILKNCSSLNQIDSPPMNSTTTSVTTCIGLILPVSRHSANIEATKTSTNTAVTAIKPV